MPEPPVTAEMQARLKAFDASNYADASKSFEAAVKKNPKDYTSYGKLGLTASRSQAELPAERWTARLSRQGAWRNGGLRRPWRAYASPASASQSSVVR